MIDFTANHTDHSNASGFQFEFHCDKCGNGYMSAFQSSRIGMAGGFLRAASGLLGGALGQVADAGDHIKDALRGPAWDAAFRTAVEEGKKHFKQCSRCGHWVCPDHCWNPGKGLCEACAPDLTEELASAQASVAREQIWEKLRAGDQTKGLKLNQEQAAVCPHCGAKSSGGKFCGECGKPLSRKTACGKCGAKIESATKFCPECGEKLA